MTKTKRLWIRISSSDYTLLEKQAEKNNLSKSQLIRLYIRNEKIQKLITTLNRSNAMHLKILLEISRVAGNINQIAYHLNSEKIQNQEAFHLFLKEAQNTKNIFAFFKNESKEHLKEISNIMD
ncbi:MULTISPECIES: plasmid mobilization protein [Helicobacter]|uniref:Ribbon-helix-helix protein, CopG family n=1 Tax=Helicobacter trogontum TaxID=50960 RepID=A0A099VDD0_9HELI|nr:MULTISPECIES: plasmid mobilization relaxosome protein MobC [Helicobacter]MDY5951507.1 plasmid mobilization relaxosome protein MobC [Helicobacter sp.]TLD84675.1 ribbon-helix-helix protein, CopG family [Helicobacter trogontum]